MSNANHHQNTILKVNCITHGVQDGMTSTIFVLLPVLAQSFGLSYAQVGMLKGINNGSQAVFEFGSGWLSELFGEARLLAVGLILAGAGYSLLSVAPDIAAIMACLVLVGAGTALHHAPSSSLIANGFAFNKRGRALGLYNAAGDLGKLAYTGVFSLFTASGVVWHYVGFAYGVAAFAAALAVHSVARTWPHSSGLNTNYTTSHTGDNAVTRWGVLNWRCFAALLGVTSLVTMVQTGIFVFLAFLMLSKGLPLALATGATVILLAGGVLGKAGCGFLADRIGARPAFILIQILTAIGLTVIIAADIWLAFVILFPLGAVVQGSSSIIYGFAASMIHPLRMARGYALLYSSGTFASAVGPLIYGWIADSSSLESAIFFMAAVTVLSIPPIWILNDTPLDLSQKV